MKALIASALSLAIATGLLAEETLFKNGIDKYSATEDATIVGTAERHESLNYGNRQVLDVSGVPWAGNKTMALIRFGGLDERVPKGTKIDRAVLRLYKVGEPQDQGQYAASLPNQLFISAFPLMKSWKQGEGDGSPDEGGVTFAFRAYRSSEVSDFWGNSEHPEQGPVKEIDFDPARAVRSALQVGDHDVWMEWDVTDLVQTWINEPEKNFGFYLTAHGSYIGSSFASSESTHVDQRPELLIVW